MFIILWQSYGLSMTYVLNLFFNFIKELVKFLNIYVK